MSAPPATSPPRTPVLAPTPDAGLPAIPNPVFQENTSNDLLTIIQESCTRLPAQLSVVIERIGQCPLSVQEAHALSQLSQTGFFGFQNVTSPFVPVGANGELIPWLTTAGDTVQHSRGFYEDVRLVEHYIQSIPDDIGMKTQEEVEAEFAQAVKEYDESLLTLKREEERLQRLIPLVEEIREKAADVLTQDLNNGAGVALNVDTNFTVDPNHPQHDTWKHQCLETIDLTPLAHPHEFFELTRVCDEEGE